MEIFERLAGLILADGIFLTKNCLSLYQEKITENGNLILIEEIYSAASTYSYVQPEALFFMKLVGANNFSNCFQFSELHLNTALKHIRKHCRPNFVRHIAPH